ncbi:hypothetical protein LBMAG14_05160 [Actinomycetes bacterium]|nr:hypothetical protein LBMAG14_05160 [Actinomycetes bacterium]
MKIKANRAIALSPKMTARAFTAIRLTMEAVANIKNLSLGVNDLGVEAGLGQDKY